MEFIFGNVRKVKDSGDCVFNLIVKTEGAVFYFRNMMLLRGLLFPPCVKTGRGFSFTCFFSRSVAEELYRVVREGVLGALPIPDKELAIQPLLMSGQSMIELFPEYAKTVIKEAANQ